MPPQLQTTSRVPASERLAQTFLDSQLDLSSAPPDQQAVFLYRSHGDSRAGRAHWPRTLVRLFLVTAGLGLSQTGHNNNGGRMGSLVARFACVRFPRVSELQEAWRSEKFHAVVKRHTRRKRYCETRVTTEAHASDR